MLRTKHWVIVGTTLALLGCQDRRGRERTGETTPPAGEGRGGGIEGRQPTGQLGEEGRGPAVQPGEEGQRPGGTMGEEGRQPVAGREQAAQFQRFCTQLEQFRAARTTAGHEQALSVLRALHEDLSAMPGAQRAEVRQHLDRVRTLATQIERSGAASTQHADLMKQALQETAAAVAALGPMGAGQGTGTTGRPGTGAAAPQGTGAAGQGTGTAIRLTEVRTSIDRIETGRPLTEQKSAVERVFQQMADSLGGCQIGGAR